MANTMLIAAIVIFVYVNLVHLVALLKKDNGLMDAAWGMGFILVALFTLGLADGLDARRILLGTLVLAWGLRLSLHILIRNAGRASKPPAMPSVKNTTRMNPVPQAASISPLSFFSSARR